MRKLIIAAGLFAVATATAAAAADRSFPATGFTAIEINGSEDVVVATGTAASVVATGPQKLIDRLDIRVDGDTLKIGHRKEISMTWGDGKVVIHVAMPMLRTVDVSGSGDLSADKASGPVFSAAATGSGDIRIALIDTPTARFNSSGSGDITAAGRCVSAKIAVSGSGDINFGGLKCADLKVGISGSGDVTAQATRMADVSVSGSGDASITGGGKCRSQRTGSGSIRCG